MAVQVLQRVFQFRTCSLAIDSADRRWQFFRPCILHNIRQCTAPCNLRVTPAEYRKQIKRLVLVMDGKKDRLLKRMRNQMAELSAAMEFERAARLRDEIAALEKLDFRGKTDADVQPHVFHTEPRKGLVGLRKVLGLRKTPRVIEGFDIAHLGGQDTVASLVYFVDGMPFKGGYRTFKIKTVAGIDDFASMREVVSRRYRRLSDDESPLPDVILIDGGKGQLNAALSAFEMLHVEPPCLISLAKKEELIFRPGESEPIRLGRDAAALRLLQSVRDEAHRFAQHYLHTLRDRRLFGE